MIIKDKDYIAKGIIVWRAIESDVPPHIWDIVEHRESDSWIVLIPDKAIPEGITIDDFLWDLPFDEYAMSADVSRVYSIPEAKICVG